MNNEDIVKNGEKNNANNINDENNKQEQRITSEWTPSRIGSMKMAEEGHAQMGEEDQ